MNVECFSQTTVLLSTEFKQGRDWVANELTFANDYDVLLFEIVIRELGGLMSAYYLSEDPIFLEKAVSVTTDVVA